MWVISIWLATLILHSQDKYLAAGAPNEDYYSLLGLSRDASDKEIKSAYRKLALKWHPDKNKSPGAEDKFRRVSEAYQVLSDPGTRTIYDQTGGTQPNAGNRGGPAPGFQFKEARDLFKDFFGGKDPFANFEEFFDIDEDVSFDQAPAPTNGMRPAEEDLPDSLLQHHRLHQQAQGIRANAFADAHMRAHAQAMRAHSHMGSIPGREGFFPPPMPPPAQGGGGGSFQSFTFTTTQGGPGATKFERTEQVLENGRMVTKTIKSDGSETHASIEETVNGKTRRRSGRRKDQEEL
eukprot:gb/GEZN01012565.1/.p1 GENE.gb/GEZN01012565.1/~~gb/GEZN01012565.1/.p1  ORF type:complete len:324 (-),score=44.90 gb/GEZN01012565.1/:100-975(-)